MPFCILALPFAQYAVRRILRVCVCIHTSSHQWISYYNTKLTHLSNQHAADGSSRGSSVNLRIGYWQRHIKFIYSLVFIHSIIVLDHLFSSLLPFTRFFFFFSWLHSPGRLDILLQEATKNRLRIIAIQESWWPGVGEFRRNDYTIIHSGSQVESRHRQGVMLILHNSIAWHISVTQTRMSTSNHASLYHSLGKYLPVYSVALINEISRCIS